MKGSFFTKLKRRNVYKVAGAYSVVGWLVMPLSATVVQAQSPVPVEKEPRHRIKFENQFVRVFDVFIPPGDATLFHTHLHDAVGIKLTDAQIKNEVLGGSVKEALVKHGAVEFSRFPSPLTHRVSNIGRAPFRNLAVEILPSSRGSGSAPSPAAVADHTVVLENERVRILRLVLAPGQSIDGRMHVLRGVRVAVSEGKILIEAPKKEDRTVKFEPGDYEWHEEGMKYSLRNVGSTPFEAVDIEIK